MLSECDGNGNHLDTTQQANDVEPCPDGQGCDVVGNESKANDVAKMTYRQALVKSGK